MPILVTPDQIAHLAPSARSSYREAFERGEEVLARFEISATPARLGHFMAQLLHESGGLTIQFENLNYSAGRLPKVWPRRFRPIGPLDPAGYAHAPETLANEVYGRRMGNNAPGDGFKFRGRGLMQLTGRDSYAAATTRLRRAYLDTPDLTLDPDAVIRADWCLKVAACEWSEKGCNALADQDSIRSITKRINGGLIGLASRMEWRRRTAAVWS